MDELKLMESAVGQCADIKVEENASVTFVLKRFTCNLEDNGCIGGKNISLNKQTWNQDLRDSLQVQIITTFFAYLCGFQNACMPFKLYSLCFRPKMYCCAITAMFYFISDVLMHHDE
jgi:hypothetical protein